MTDRVPKRWLRFYDDGRVELMGEVPGWWWHVRGEYERQQGRPVPEFHRPGVWKDDITWGDGAPPPARYEWGDGLDFVELARRTLYHPTGYDFLLAEAHEDEGSWREPADVLTLIARARDDPESRRHLEAHGLTDESGEWRVKGPGSGRPQPLKHAVVVEVFDYLERRYREVWKEPSTAPVPSELLRLVSFVVAPIHGALSVEDREHFRNALRYHKRKAT